MQDTEVLSVPFAGRGQVDNASGVYFPGDYESLRNVIITPEGTLRKREPAKGLRHDRTVPIHKIIGSWGPHILFSSFDNVGGNPRVLYSSKFTEIKPATLSNLAAFKTTLATQSGYSSGTSYVLIEKMFQYLDDMYAVIVHSNKDTVGAITTFTRKLYVVKIIDYNNATSHSDIVIEFDLTLANLVSFGTQTTAIDTSAPFRLIPVPPVPNSFTFKERAWVASGDTLYFSKATDVIKFAPGDDGGFFKFPAKVIKDVVALGDLIYVIFEDSIHVITYNTSPNVDAKVSIISSGEGGKSATVYGDTVFVLNHTSIYTVNGTNVSKLLDLTVPLTSTIASVGATNLNTLTDASVTDLKIVAYKNALYVLARRIHYNNASGTIDGINFKSDVYTIYTTGRMFRISLDNGSCSQYHYSQTVAKWHAADLAVVFFGAGVEESSRLFVLLANTTEVRYGSIFHSFEGIYSGGLPPSKITDYGLDSFVDEDDETSLTVGPIECLISIKNIIPDGVGYWQKKWRVLQIQGKLPSTILDAEADEQDLSVPYVPELLVSVQAFNKAHQLVMSTAFSELEFSNNRAEASSGYAYAINQRSPSMGIVIQTRTDYEPRDWGDISDPYILASKLELVDLSFLWTKLRSMSNNGRRFSTPL
jgi:hypothetical protein